MIFNLVLAGSATETKNVAVSGLVVIYRFMSIISGSSWHSRLGIRHFQILYECDLAILRASDRVTEQLQNLRQYDHTDKAIFSNCIKHYIIEHQEAYNRIVQSNQQIPEATRIAGKQIVHRVAARSRRQAIANLLEDGVISTTVDKTVREQLRNKIYYLSKQFLRSGTRNALPVIFFSLLRPSLMKEFLLLFQILHLDILDLPKLVLVCPDSFVIRVIVLVR